MAYSHLYPSVLLVMLGCVLPMPPAGAATDGCAPSRSQPVEHFICDHPALHRLAGRVDRAARTLADDHPAQRAAIERDQHNWYAQTLADGWAALHADSHPLTRLNRRYRQRLAYLQARRNPPADAPRAIQRVQRTLTGMPADFDGDALDYLKHDGIVTEVRDNNERGYDDAEDAAHALRLHPTPALDDKLGHFFQKSLRVHARRLPGSSLGVIYQLQGTAHCFYGVWFDIDDHGRAHPLAKPGLDGPAEGGHAACWTQTAHLITIQGRPFFLRDDQNEISQTVLNFQPFTDGDWGTPTRVVVRFDRHLADTPRVARHPGRNDDVWADLAMPLARAFARRPTPGFNVPALTPRGRQRFNHMRALAQAAPAAYDNAPLADINDSQPLGAYTGFGNAAVYFPAAVPGHILLGRIGRPHIGWRQADGWLLGFWGLDDRDNLVPLAGVRVDERSGRYLGSTIVPMGEQG